MPKLLDPSNDYVFKILFREPSDEPRLIAMLTAILEPAVPIVSAQVMNPEMPADLARTRSLTLDLRVRLADRRDLFIELERWPDATFPGRWTYSWARLHGRQLRRGQDFAELRPTIGIAWAVERPVLRRRPGPPRVHSRFAIRDVLTGEPLTNHLEMHLLDLTNLGRDATLSEALSRWAEFLASPTSDVLERLANEDPIMADTIEKLRRLSAEEIHFHNADSRRHQEWAAEYREKAGLLIARREARAEARAEERASLARTMLKKGLPREQVADILGIGLDALDEVLAEASPES